MEPRTKRDLWTNFIKFYSDENRGRSTRIGVFQGNDDYWLENGLPLTGIAVDARTRFPSIEIMLEGFTHSIKEVRSIKANFSNEGDEDGLDLVDAEGKTTLLRFESLGH